MCDRVEGGSVSWMALARFFPIFAKKLLKLLAFSMSSVKISPNFPLIGPIEADFKFPWKYLTVFQNSLLESALENLDFQ